MRKVLRAENGLELVDYNGEVRVEDVRNMRASAFLDSDDQDAELSDYNLDYETGHIYIDDEFLEHC